MKKFLVLAASFMLLAIGCGNDQTEFKLQKETPSYELAEKISAKLPYFDPEENKVMVTSNKFNVTSGEVIYKIKKNMGNRANQLADMSEAQLKENMDRFANILGEQKLLLREADEEGIEITETAIDSVLTMQYQRSGGEEKFQQFLEKNGQSMDDIRKNIAEGLVIQKYINDVVYSGVDITEEDIEDAYKEDKTATVRHILLNTRGKSDSAKQAIKEKMEEILEKAKSGEDFAELAKQYSEDPGSKARGGLYENIQKGAMVKPFEERAFSLPIGEISDVFETQYGYHILKVIERNKETQPLEEVHQQIEEALKKQRYSDAYQEALENLKTKYDYKVVELG